MTIANYLTLTRIFLLPFFLFFFFWNIKYHYLIAGIIFIFSSLTDLFDGYIARKFNQVSALGRILDPLADKLTFIAVFIALAIKGIIPMIVIGIILFRELIILFGSIYLYYQSSDIISPSKTGKTATFLLYITAAAYIWNLSFLKPAVFIAIGLAFVSGIRYCLEGYDKYFNKQRYDFLFF
ncbi:CDP-diacylglycerol--glycerol-3-phosphate 3-phosphatidyltransferase [Halanaerocella petrolearia]